MQTMITIDFDKIEAKRKKIGLTRAELARRVGREEDTLLKFIQSGKKLTQHINLINKICEELNLPLWGKNGVIN